MCVVNNLWLIIYGVIIKCIILFAQKRTNLLCMWHERFGEEEVERVVVDRKEIEVVMVNGDGA